VFRGEWPDTREFKGKNHCTGKAKWREKKITEKRSEILNTKLHGKVGGTRSDLKPD